MQPDKQENTKTYKYYGAIHIHSEFSDGSGNIEEITMAAKASGLDWIIVTDHNNFEIREGIINGITVIKGEEISQPDRNHYLCLGINKCIYPSENIAENIEEVRRNNGFGFAAHPDELDNRKNKYKPIKWTDKTVIPDGVEIWNWFSQWADNYNGNNIFTSAYSYFFKHNLVKKPNRNTLDWWDKLNCPNEKIIPAIGGVDAHALKVKNYIIPVTVFPYKTLFKTIGNQIIIKKPLAESFANRKEQILTALKNGNNIIINRKTYNKAPEIYVKRSNKTAFCGEEIYLDDNTYLHFNCDKYANIKIFRNGQFFTENKAKTYEFKLNKIGKYRIEAEINGYGYAYSNPIIVKEENFS